MSADKCYTNGELASDYLIAAGSGLSQGSFARIIRRSPINIHEHYKQEGTFKGLKALKNKGLLSILELLLSGQKTAEELRQERHALEDEELRRFSHRRY